MAKTSKGVLSEEFVDEIPPITKEGGTRRSKYDDKAEKSKKKTAVKKLVLDKQSTAASRAATIRERAKIHEDALKFTVTSRKNEVYVGYGD